MIEVRDCLNWRSVLTLALTLVLPVWNIACQRLPPKVNCVAIRQLQIGMDESDVRRLVGDPVRAAPFNAAVGENVIPRVIWDYGLNPSTLELRITFERDRVVGAIASGHLLSHQTLFVLESSGVKESPAFSSAFCR